PSDPLGVKVSDTGSNFITISWTGIKEGEGIVGFGLLVKPKNEAAPPIEIILNANIRTYTIAAIQPCKLFDITIFSLTSDNTSPGVLVEAETKLPTVTGVSGKQEMPGSIKVKWSKLDQQCFDAYRISLSSSLEELISIAEKIEEELIIPGAIPDTDYEITVATVAVGKSSPPSSPIKLKTGVFSPKGGK
ncbi:unnamed protein product, partial [Protopolystoma xenopodis]